MSLYLIAGLLVVALWIAQTILFLVGYWRSLRPRRVRTSVPSPSRTGVPFGKGAVRS